MRCPTFAILVVCVLAGCGATTGETPTPVAPTPTLATPTPSLLTPTHSPSATPTATAAATTSPSPSPTAPPPTPTPEAVVPLAGFGFISGACGEIDPDDLYSPDPQLLLNAIDFGEDEYSEEVLSDDGQVLYNSDNAGGSSEASEVMSFEVLYRCELADLLKTETEIDYDAEGSITDILVEIDGERVGVSVTRAVTAPGAAYTLEDATRVLTKKLEGVKESSANVSEDDRWVKQILHILAVDANAGAMMQQAWTQASAELKADTVVMVTVTDGDDTFIYYQ